MSSSLPGWAVSGAESVRSEAEPYIHVTPAERLSVLAAVCRAAGKLLRSRTDIDVALRYHDPLPARSVSALERLRKAHRKQ